MTPAVVLLLALDATQFVLLVGISWGLHALRGALGKLNAAYDACAVDAFGRPLRRGQSG